MNRSVAWPLLVAAAACAQPGTPPGGDVDRAPPRVIAVTPEPFSTLEDLSEPVVIQFDERISERFEGVRELRAAVLVSPRTGVVRADRGRHSIEVSLEGGWQPDRVYRVVVQPVLRDLFNNQRTDPVELVFSTGAPIVESALAGFVRNRLTGDVVEGARVEALRGSDSTTYVALTDTAGFFAMRYIPPGSYTVRTWQDQDRDDTPDFNEPQATADALLDLRDTVVVEQSLLLPDTTPARLARAQPISPSLIRLLFDDYFAVGPVDGRAVVLTVRDTALVSTGRLFHGSRLDSLEAALGVAPDSAALEAGGEPGAEPGDSADAGAAAEDAGEEGGAAGGGDQGDAPGEDGETSAEVGEEAGAAEDAAEPLPSRELILLLPSPLPDDSTYLVRAFGLTNIRGVREGGGTVQLRIPAATAPADSATAPADSMAVPADSLAIPADSAAIPPDSAAVPVDSTPVAPDTVP